jgi:uncharacterized protein (TIGR02117 family)
MRVIVVAAVLAAAGCAGPVVSLPPWPDGESLRGPLKEIWVVRHGWHTRVAVRRADVDPSIWPESRDLGDVAYLEVGWGDRDFYPNSDPSIWDTIDPVIRATPAALHVGGLDRAPSELFPDTAVVRLSVSAHGIDRLARFVSDHYVRDAAGAPRRIGSGHYARSWFYLAEGRYHALTYNSNNWTATALKAAGAPTDPSVAVTAGTVIRQTRKIAESKAGRRTAAEHLAPSLRLNTSRITVWSPRRR